jgi:acetate kinase
MKVLVVNSGSSSLKFRIYEMPAETVLVRGIIERIGQAGSRLVLTYESACPAEMTQDMAKQRRAEEAGKLQHVVEQDIPDHGAALELMLGVLTDANKGILSSLKEIEAVGHRAVLGGKEITESVIVDENVIRIMEEYSDIVPLHNPPNIKGMRACLDKLPGVPNVAVFDTAFHQTMPDYAYMYAIPYKLYEKYRVRRYGFHGTSHRYVSMRAAELMGRPQSELEMVTLHMGNGSSVCAVKYGKSIDTSMGFSPTTGIPMGTRTGDIDPIIVTYLQGKLGMTKEQIDSLMNKESGLIGISGYSDMRDIEEHAKAREQLPELAMRIVSYAARKYIGAYATAMGALDAIVFTAGIGENDALLRAMILNDLEFLGVQVDELANQQMIRGAEGFISTPQSRVKVLVVPTNEELLIARDAVDVVEKNVRYVPGSEQAQGCAG